MTNKKINYDDLFDFLKVFPFMKAREYIIIKHCVSAFEYLIHHSHSIVNVVVTLLSRQKRFSASLMRERED